MKALDLPVLWALTLWSWLTPAKAPPPISHAPPAGCECCVAAGRVLHEITFAELRDPAAREQPRKGQ